MDNKNPIFMHKIVANTNVNLTHPTQLMDGLFKKVIITRVYAQFLRQTSSVNLLILRSKERFLQTSCYQTNTILVCPIYNITSLMSAMNGIKMHLIDTFQIIAIEIGIINYIELRKTNTT